MGLLVLHGAFVQYRKHNITEENELVKKGMLIKDMAELRFYSPLKIGLLLVVLAYFLFTFHALFTVSWIGEWEYVTGSFSFWILITDISASFTLIFRFIASIIAITTMVYYLAKKGISTPKTFKVLRWILILEAIYWLGLLVSGVWGVFPLRATVTDYILTLQFSLALLITTGIPCLVSSIAIPIALFKLASTLDQSKPKKDSVKWGLIAGTIYIFVFWLNNTGMWIATVMSKGTEYLTTHPENLLSFASTTVGLLALTAFTAHFLKKSIGTATLEKLKLRTLGAIIVALGLYFLWNYLTWIFFGGDTLWSEWYAWFLGHNLDLWLLSLPLIGLPLLFKRQTS
jgi:hypothetical protein